MGSTLPDSNEEVAPDADTDAAPQPAVYFDGISNRRHLVTLTLGPELDINENGVALASWRYDDLRAAEAGDSRLRLQCSAASPLARLEIFDPATQAGIRAHARLLQRGTRGQTGRIVVWSLAAVASIVAIIMFGVPLVADRLTPLVPQSFERRLGEVAENQVRTILRGQVCNDPEGNRAFSKLVGALREAGHVELPLQTAILSSPVPNAFALPGGKVYLLNGLLQKANNPDEIAGVIAHEIGHVVHRDHTRLMIQNGGMSFLIGLLFGDVTGATAVIGVTKTVLEASYSREAEANADAFAIDTMHALHRSPAPLGELLFRITGARGGSPIGILASHPLTEQRRELMQREDRPATGPEILSGAEWKALKTVCQSSRQK
ncbi:MAG TPA: M48 family metallopeptidase [Pseudolabrys sp.]|nr:M48 family metallopeptidase [Pseudolabrys sp.]